MKKTLLLFAFALSAVAPSWVAHADHDFHAHGPCAADMKKFCGDVKMDDHEAMMKCMKDNEDKVSDSCKAEHAKMRQKMEGLMAACKSDVESLCKDVKKGDHHAVHDCLMKNEDKLSDACKTEHTQMMKKMKEHKAHESAHHETN